MFDYNDYGGLLKINKCKAPANRHSGNQPDGPPTDMECDHPPEEMITLMTWHLIKRMKLLIQQVLKTFLAYLK